MSIGAWVLMPNHFHIYITSHKPSLRESDKSEENKANIALFMHKLCVGYVKYFNQKYNRTGSLFEGNFKSIHFQFINLISQL